MIARWPLVAIGAICFFYLNRLVREGKTTPPGKECKSVFYSDWINLM